ncbi:MAG: HAMP domain-containing histidine kinase [Bacteroidetes bacterium]|nr:HAMP domain-containing histidine kinase [Bacteroidota bacterium]
MRTFEKMIHLLKLNSIRSRMLSGFLFLTLLIICVAAVSIYILDRTNHIIAIHTRISQLEITTLSLLKTDNDFFDLETINPNYFETHESTYLSRRDSLKKLIALSSEEIIQQNKNGVASSLQKIDSALMSYDQKFLLLESLLFKKGFKDYGLEGQMRFHAHKLEESQFNLDLYKVLSLRRNEKDFFLRHEVVYIQNVNQIANSFLEELSKNKSTNQAALYHLQQYTKLFNELAVIQIQIGLSSKEGLRSDLNRLSDHLAQSYFSLSKYSDEVSSAAQMRVRVFFLAIVAGAVIFSLISGYWISKKLSYPIAKLSSLMNNVVGSKKYTRSFFTTEGAAEEITTLTKSFAHLIRETEAQMTEIKSKSRQLKGRNLELKKLNRELDSFIYSTAHDLRSPLTSLLGLLNIMKYENQQDSIKPHIQMMENSIYRMEDFIEQIVGYSKNKRLSIQPTKIDFQILLSEVFDNHQFVPGASKIKHLVEVREKSPYYSDRGRLLIVFNNLISNAIRYADFSKAEPFVRVHLVVDTSEVTISFIDNGIGIGPEHVDKIFNMFYRANASSKGSGLGLFIFKETIMKLRGHVSVESTLGVGTKFFIQLPNMISGVNEQMEIPLAVHV